jgi:hypothetical protein
VEERCEQSAGGQRERNERCDDDELSRRPRGDPTIAMRPLRGVHGEEQPLPGADQRRQEDDRERRIHRSPSAPSTRIVAVRRGANISLAR